MRRVFPMFVLGLCSACAGNGANRYWVNEEEFIGDSAGERYMGGSCSVLDNGGSDSFGAGGSGSTGGAAGPASPYSFSVQEFQDGSGFRIVVSGNGGQVLAVRSYSAEFLASGKVDDFTVPLGSDTHLRLRHWGALTCDFAIPEAGTRE